MDYRNKKPTKYLWVDLEMTGLDVYKERIIEIAAIITDTDLNEISDFHAVVQQPQEFLDAMDEWNQTHHKKSGLLDLIPEGKDQNSVETELISWIEKHYSEEHPILAGNSIAQDKLFIDHHMKKLSSLLHYRMLDVTSWKIPFWVKNIEMKKRGVHRAIDDIKESIKEFKTYLKFIDFDKDVNYSKK